jgi:protoporphyrinogen oxidase
MVPMRPSSRYGSPGHVAIIGAGPCGLACARELTRLGYDDWAVYEAGVDAGGHAGSVVDPAGFTWDFGGHVVFSHFGEFDSLLVEVLGDELYEHERSSYVRFADRWVPYPFQNNLRHLPAEVALECLLGLIEAPGADGAVDFATWMERVFGAGITRHFMRPYNRKVWATPAERMSADWIAERVSVVDYGRALRSIVLAEDDVGWGPNNTFLFPKRGGTGEVYRRLAARLGPRVEFRREVVSIDPRRRRLRFADGATASYGALVSTMPLDGLVGRLADCPSSVRNAAATLEHNSVVVVGVGYERPLEDDRSWLYFPDPAVPFYRVTNFAKYSPANVPGDDVRRYSSYMTETAYSPSAPEDPGRLAQRVVEGLVRAGVTDGDAPVCSVHSIDVPYAYPVPTVGLGRALAEIQPWLREQGIYSRGRFGSWRYEIGNMDHAVKMGADVARLLVEGRPEEVFS